MYKTIKISETAYKHAEDLRAEFAKEEAKLGTRKISLSETVSYAINEALKTARRKDMLKASAGGWADINSDSLIKDIYASRLKKTRDINL
jgi:hypothetical protein